MKTPLTRGWKHPFHSDTWDTLSAARAAHPFIQRFSRVWAHHGAIKRQSGELVRDRFTLTWRRTMDEENPEITATARAILSRRQQKQVLVPAALWPIIVEDVRALGLQQESETALLRAVYRLIFLISPSPL
jgi:hypothetical protein